MYCLSAILSNEKYISYSAVEKSTLKHSDNLGSSYNYWIRHWYCIKTRVCKLGYTLPLFAHDVTEDVTSK